MKEATAMKLAVIKSAQPKTWALIKETLTTALSADISVNEAAEALETSAGILRSVGLSVTAGSLTSEMETALKKIEERPAPSLYI